MGKRFHVDASLYQATLKIQMHWKNNMRLVALFAQKQIMEKTFFALFFLSKLIKANPSMHKKSHDL